MSDHSTLVPCTPGLVVPGCLVRVSRGPLPQLCRVVDVHEGSVAVTLSGRVLYVPLSDVDGVKLSDPLTAARAAGWLVGAETAAWAWGVEADSKDMFLSVADGQPWEVSWQEWNPKRVPALADPDLSPAEALAAVVRWKRAKRGGDDGR